MSDDGYVEDYCTCPVGRPLGMPHLEGCPEKAAEVLVFRQPETGRPVAVPNEIVSKVERAYEAYQQRLRGKSWEKIAVDGLWPDAKSVAREVQLYLDEGKAVMAGFKRLEVLAIELARLDMLQDAVWDEAMKGKVPSVMAALQIHRQRVAVLGLDQPSEEDTQAPTVVVPSEDYIAQLRAQAEAG